MTVVPFRRPPEKTPKAPAPSGRRTVAEFAVAVGMLGLGFYLLPTIWPSAPNELLAVINLIVSAAYVQFLGRTARVAPYGWIALSLVLLYLTGSPSPASYALSRAVEALGAASPV